MLQVKGFGVYLRAEREAERANGWKREGEA